MSKLKTFLFLAFTGIAVLFSAKQSSALNTDPVAKAFAQKEISYTDYVYYELLSMFDESKLPAGFKTVGTQEPTRDATLLLLYARRHFNSFRPEQQQVLSSLFARPTDSGDTYKYSVTEATPYCTTNFCIHYVASTADAPPLTDTTPANGTPDYVEFMATEFENVFTTENSGMGYTTPPADGTKGGNSKFDVYIKDIDSAQKPLYGFAQQETCSGTSCTSWMGMDNDYANISPNDYQKPVRVTAAHEYYHSVQFGYFSSLPTWLMESTAAWVEDEVYDSINDNYQYKDLFTKPENALDLVESDGATDNGYSKWFLHRFISEKYGRNNIKKFFENGASSCGNSADEVALRLCVYDLIDTTLQQNTGAPTLKSVFANFAQRNYTKVGSDNIYKEGASYQDIAIATTHTSYPVTTQTSTLNHLAAKYYQFTAADANNNVLTITFNGPDGKDFAAKIIKVTSGGTKTEDAISLNSSTNDGTFQLAGFGSTYSKVVLVAINMSKIASDATITQTTVNNQTITKVNTNGNTDGLTYTYSAASAVFSGPSAPTGVSATAGDAQVALSWTAATAGSFSIASYNVYRSSTSGGTQTKINTSAVTSTSYTDKGLTNGTKYYYVVKAVDSQGNESSASSEVNATPYAKPSAPTGVFATAGDGKVTLSWTAPTKTTYDVSSYNVYRSTSSGTGYSKINSSAVTTTSYTDSTVTNGTKYYYVVTSVDSQGNESANSSEANATPVAPVSAPSAPTGVSASAGDSQAAISWSSVSGATSYNIYMAEQSGVTASNYSTLTGGMKHTGVTSPYTHTGLTNGTKYYFIVTAANSGGESSASGEVNATPYAKPSAPSGVSATAGDGKVTLSWTAPTKTTYTVSSYNVYRSATTGTGYSKINSSTVTSTSYTDSTVTNGTKYYYVVTSVDSQSNESANSSEANATPAAAPVNPPSTPDNVTATAGDTQVSLSWSASTAGTYSLAGYNVYRSTSSGTGYTKINSSTVTSRSYTDKT